MKRALVFALCVAAASALADVPTGAYCYDGGKKIALTRDATRVAEFTKAGAKSAVLQANPGAAELKAGAGGPRIFKVAAASFKPRTENGTATSPVFRMGTSPAGRLMALPGGIVVTFKAELTDAQIRQWATAKGFEVQQKMAIQGNWYVLKTGPGQASLDAANKLQESGEVLTASPNWWKDTVTK